MAAIQETGYLTPRSTYQKTLFGQGFPPIKLGVLLPNWTGHFRWEIMRGIEAAQAELTDFHVKILVEECETDIPEESIEKLDALLEAGIQGAAVCTMNDPSIEEKIRSLTQKDIPVITFNSDLPAPTDSASSVRTTIKAAALPPNSSANASPPPAESLPRRATWNSTATVPVWTASAPACLRLASPGTRSRS